MYVYGICCEYGAFNIIAVEVEKISTSNHLQALNCFHMVDGDVVNLKKINRQYPFDTNTIDNAMFFFLKEKTAIRFIEIFKQGILDDIDNEIKSLLSFKEKIQSYKTEIKRFNKAENAAI